MVTPASFGVCPPRTTLIDFSCGRLPEPTLESIAEHLAVCQKCLGVLAEIQHRAAENGVDAWLRVALDANTRSASVSGGEPPAGSPRAPFPVSAPTDAAAETRTASGDGASPTWNLGGVERRETLVGTTLGPYKILEKLGEGGMGVVYRATREPVNQLVAVKTIRTPLEPDPDRLARFRTEGAALARLNHPNVVRLYHFDDHRGNPYFTMELVTGGDLARKLKAGPLACAEAAALVRALAGAVAYLHGERVIHRDLKPHNVLLTANGTPKVSDFGLAKLLDAESELTFTGEPMGTPNYMSPEQAEGVGEHIGPMTDVYALGAILYACLTARPPFEGKSRQHILEQVRTKEPERPAVRRADVPADLEAVCLKCLEKDAGRRYGSAQELADDLGHWIRGEATIARPLTRTRRLARWVRRNARRGTALVLGTAAVLGAIAFFSRPPANPDDPDPTALTRYRNEVARGAPVTLIPESGRPRWWEWRTAATHSRTSVGTDGTFQAVTWGMGLLELMPDPGTERFRFSALIRHEKADPLGSVGLYCGRTDHPGRGAGVHFFIRATFNDIFGAKDLPKYIGPGSRDLSQEPNRVGLYAVAYEEGGVQPEIERPTSGAAGHEFTRAGQQNTGWHELALVVGPEGIRVEWDGQAHWTHKGTEKTLELTADTLATQIQEAVHGLRDQFPQEPFAKTLGPKFTPGGGVGIFLCRGQASFRSVTLTPLPK